MKEQVIYFLIVNYNGSEDTIKLLKSIESLECSSDTSLQAIIIDNNSEISDTTNIKAFISNLEWVTFLKSKSNIGYFPAFNVGLDHIRDKLPATVLLCNNDLIFEKYFLKLHFEEAYNNDVFVVAPNVITSNGVHQNPHLISKISRFRKLLNELYFSHYFIAKMLKAASKSLSKFRSHSKMSHSLESQYIHMGIGACYILRPVFFNHTQTLDDRVFLGGEEALLARQLEKVHGKTYYNSQLVVHHAEGASFSQMPTKWRYEVSKKSYMIYKGYL